MEVQTNETARAMTELIEVTRALAEGDFERPLEISLQGELGQLAAHIEILRENLKLLSPRVASSVHLIPKAGQGVAEISQQAEVSVNSILGLVDDMCADQDVVAAMLGKAKNGDLASLDIAKLQEIADKTSASLMSMMSFLSFQDVVRQRAEKVQAMIDMVDEKIRDLLAKFRVPVDEALDEDSLKSPGEIGLTNSEAVDQSSIDDLFKSRENPGEDSVE
jgi:methyl-accepting chemotaxis protein